MPATRIRDRLGQQRQRAQTMERKSSIMLAGHMQYNAGVQLLPKAVSLERPVKFLIGPCSDALPCESASQGRSLSTGQSHRPAI